MMVFVSTEKYFVRTLVAGLALTMTAVATPAASSNLKLVCASYQAASKTIRVDVASGCTSSSHRYLGHDIKVDIDEETARISLSGGFKYAKPATNIVTSDCAGQKKLKLPVPGVAARRYSVFTKGVFRGVFDFTKSHARSCVSPLGTRSGALVVSSMAARDGLERALSVKQGATIQEIIKPLMRELAVSGEGRGTLSLSIEKVFTGGENAPPRAKATIEAHGLADDAVSGVFYEIDFVALPAGWKAVGLQRKQMCGRGPNAGMWTAQNCN